MTLNKVVVARIRILPPLNVHSLDHATRLSQNGTDIFSMELTWFYTTDANLSKYGIYAHRRRGENPGTKNKNRTKTVRYPPEMWRVVQNELSLLLPSSTRFAQKNTKSSGRSFVSKPISRFGTLFFGVVWYDSSPRSTDGWNGMLCTGGVCAIVVGWSHVFGYVLVLETCIGTLWLIDLCLRDQGSHFELIKMNLRLGDRNSQFAPRAKGP
jgi:hypothetical protein